jgi:hypothetical protein
VGPVATVNTARFLNIRDVGPAVSFGLQANLTLPVRNLALTIRGFATFPTDTKGTLDCFPELICLAVLFPFESEAQVWSGTVGLSFRPWDGPGRIRPFVLGAVGLKQEWVRWEARESRNVQAGDRMTSSGAVVLGVGFDVDFGGIPLRFEVTDIWTPEGDVLTGPPGPSLSSAWPPRRESRHDLHISLGWIMDLG